MLRIESDTKKDTVQRSLLNINLDYFRVSSYDFTSRDGHIKTVYNVMCHDIFSKLFGYVSLESVYLRVTLKDNLELTCRSNAILCSVLLLFELDDATLTVANYKNNNKVKTTEMKKKRF